MTTPSPATQCPHCGNWIYTRLYYRQHVQECVNRTPAMKDLSDGALEVLYQQSDRVNILRNNPDLCDYCDAEEYSPDCCQTRHHTIQEEDDHEYCGCESDLMTLIENSDLPE